MQALKFRKKTLFYLDQTKLPAREHWRRCLSLKEGWRAIKELRVRGAPLIGVFAAYCASLHLNKISGEKDIFLKQAKESFDYLKSARPTAVNLFWALDRLTEVMWSQKEKSLRQIKEKIIREAKFIHSQDQASCLEIARQGSKLIQKKDNVLTYCNTGFLATSGCGTALGVIYQTQKQGKKIKVYVSETRPLLQGARLTAWELSRKRIRHFLITDNTAAFLMQKKKINKIIVGADRITSSGSAANKIGTYNLAVLANYHKIPFFLAAPASTFDLSLKKAEEIIVEKRGGKEVKKVLGKILIAPGATKAVNFAFDLIPSSLITAIITDKGIIYPPYKKNIKKLIQ